MDKKEFCQWLKKNFVMEKLILPWQMWATIIVALGSLVFVFLTKKCSGLYRLWKTMPSTQRFKGFVSLFIRLLPCSDALQSKA